MRCVRRSLILRRLIDEAGRAAAKDASALNFGNGELVEGNLAESLDTAAQERISDETIVAIRQLADGTLPGLGRVEGIRWAWSGVGKLGADFRLDVVGDEGTGICWLNHKTQATSNTKREQLLGSVQPIIKVARGLDPTSGTSVEVEAAAIAFLLGTERIRGNADLHVLCSTHRPDGSLVSLHTQGLLSGVLPAGGGGLRLAWRRQGGQGRTYNALFERTGGLLPRSWDVSRALGKALLPPPRSDVQQQAQEIANALADGADLDELLRNAA